MATGAEHEPNCACITLGIDVTPILGKSPTALDMPARGARCAGFALEFLLLQGQCALTVMDDEHDCWLPSTVVEAEGDGIHVFRLAVELSRGTRFSLFISNDRPRGGQSHVVLRRLLGSVPRETLVRGTDRGTDAPPVLLSIANNEDVAWSAIERQRAVIDRLAANRLELVRAKDVLRFLLETQELHQQHHDRLRSQLGLKPDGA